MQVNQYIRGLQHLGIPTKKMSESIVFYEKLGFQIINEENQVNNGGQVVFLENQGLVIELWDNVEATGVNGAIDHIALDVVNIQDLYQQIQNEKMNVVSDGIETLHYWKKGISYFIVAGPNGEHIEFCQINL